MLATPDTLALLVSTEYTMTQRTIFDDPDEEGARARHTDPWTSHEAARSVKVGSINAAIIRALTEAPGGYTSEELAEVTGIPLVCVSPQLRPMTRDGLLYEDGHRKNRSGKRAIVWKVTGQHGYA